MVGHVFLGPPTLLASVADSGGELAQSREEGAVPKVIRRVARSRHAPNFLHDETRYLPSGCLIRSPLSVGQMEDIGMLIIGLTTGTGAEHDD